MNLVYSLVIGVLFGAGTYLLLRRTVVRVLLGLTLIGNGTNLLIFTVGGLVRGKAPITPDGQLRPASPVADPMVQAMILTAIVISFALLAFSLALAQRLFKVAGTENFADLTDEIP